jgi:hypothetical protein
MCGAKTRNGGAPCKGAAMANGRCRMHGGKAGRPPTHGRYSVKHRASLAASIDAFRSDPEPGNLLDELALMRALTQDVVDRFPDGVPLPLDAVETVSGFLAETSRLVERMAKIETQRQLAAGDAAYLLEVFTGVIEEFVPEHERQRAVESLRARVLPRQTGSALRAAIA